MALKFVVLCATLAVARAGYLAAPAAAYSPATAVSTSYISQPLAAVHAAPVAAYAAPVATYAAHAAPVAAIHAPAVGASHQSVLRSLGGNQAVSHYSKAVDSAFSTVRKYDTRITNDALTVAHSPIVAHAAPVAYAAQAAPVAYAAHAAPVATYAAHAAPVATYAAHAAPVATYAAPAAVSYSPASVVSHTTFAGLGAHYEW